MASKQCKIVLMLIFSTAFLGVMIRDFFHLPLIDIISVWNERSVIRVPYTPNASRWTKSTFREDTKNGPSIFHRHRPWTILTSTNAAYLDFCDNWLESLKRCGIKDHITVFAEDDASFYHLGNRTDVDIAVRRPATSNTPSDFLAWGSTEYVKLINRRPRYIRTYLEQGIDVLFSDLDVVWTENPLAYLPEGYDMHVVEDMHKEYVFLIEPQWLAINMGFTYFSATNATLEVVRKWDRMLAEAPNAHDQDVLNDLLEKEYVRKKLNINVLDYRRFPNGWQYFNDDWRAKHADISPVVVHNDYLQGHDTKMARFIRTGLWYIDQAS